MNRHDALLRTVIENPDDDFPRLCFADHLEENGDPARAEFIRLGVEFGHSSGCKLCEGKRTSRDLSIETYESGVCRCSVDLLLKIESLEKAPHPSNLCENHTVWAGTAAHFVLPQSVDLAYQFERGFVRSVGCRWGQWEQFGDRVARENPVRLVRLTDTPNPRMHFHERFDPALRAHVLVADWDSGSCSLSIADEEIRISRDRGQMLYAVTRQQIREAALDAYLKQKWPRQEFIWTTRYWRNYSFRYQPVSREQLAEARRSLGWSAPLVQPQGSGVGPT